MTAEKLELTAPPLPATEVLRRNLMNSLAKCVTEDDTDAICAKMVEQAKAGDTKARRDIIALGTVSQQRPTVYMQQAVVGGEQDEQAAGVKYLSDYRWNLVQLLAANVSGLTTLEVARAMHMQLSEAALALDHDWFRKDAGRWFVTPAAEEDVLKPLAQVEQHRLNGATTTKK